MNIKQDENDNNEVPKTPNESVMSPESSAPPPEQSPIPPSSAGNANPAILYAGFWRRFVAAVIDTIVLSVPFTITLGIFGMNVGSIVITWIYFASFHSSSWQATIGKKVLGLQVTHEDGSRLTFARATGRYFATILSALILFIGFMMAGWTQRKQALHDRIVCSLVIRVNK